jgi:ATP-binding cassette subfamily F protein uup
MEEDGDISGFVGKCSEYIEYREELKKSAAAETAKATASQEKTPANEQTSSASTSTQSEQKKKLSYKEKKEFEQLNEEIPALEAEQKSLEEKMSSSNYDEVRAAGERYKEIEALLEEKYPRWEELAERA